MNIIFKVSWIILIFLAVPYSINAQVCGVDIHIANDNSGSVDATENRQARAFASQLGMSFAPLGISNTESRINISTWSWQNSFAQYTFPIAGNNYTTNLSDVLSYASSARTFGGGTDVYKALRYAQGIVNQTPVSGRSVPKVIVLMTDASCYQIASGIKSLATQLKSQGIYIVVMALDAATSCTVLQGTNVASPGGYFAADEYVDIQNDVIAYINGIRNSVCTNAPPPTYDLTVSLSNFEITNCSTTPTASVNYTVTNGGGSAFNDNLRIAFYNGNPTVAGTQHLFTIDAGTQALAAFGGTYSSSTNNSALVNASTIYAVVNYDGAAVGNEPPLAYATLSSKLFVSGEGLSGNNISVQTNRIDGVGCTPYAQLDVYVRNTGLACDNEVTYTIQVCNTGTAAANVLPSSYLTAYPPSVYTLVSSELIGASPFVGNTLPDGNCATYLYVYNLDNAVASTTYDFSVDVKEIQPLPGDITLEAGQVHFVASIFDTDYLPYTAPTGPAVQGPVVADGTPDPTIDVQGSLTTTGVTLQIPYTVLNASVNLPAFSQTVNVPASLTEDGISRDVTLSYPAQTLAVGTGVINATMQSVGGTLNVDKLDMTGGLGDGSESILVTSAGPTTKSVLGLLLAKFTLVVDNLANTGEIHLRGITCQNDISVGTGAVVQMMYNYKGTYNTTDYSWCAREVTTAGFTWLDRNLGAYRVPTNATTDPAGRGDLYQWGRRMDGHQKRYQRTADPLENNGTAGQVANSTTTTLSNNPTNALFITSNTTPFTWRVANNDATLWNVGSPNMPCPSGYRIPTQAEMAALDASISPQTPTGAFNSPLKLPSSGSRSYSTGALTGSGLYWTTTLSGNDNAFIFYIQAASITTTSVFSFANGISVRCIKN